MLQAELQQRELERELLVVPLPLRAGSAAVSAADGALVGAGDDALGAEPVVQLLLPLLAMLPCCCQPCCSGSSSQPQ